MTILDEIVAQKRQEADRLPPLAPRPDTLEPRRSLEAALAARGPVALVAEIKRRSPSRPLIRADFDPPAMARAYAAGGAAALSVLTDERYFGGSLEHLREARAACDLPILRKDFIVDARQVREAKLAGADAILLIAASLTGAELAGLRDVALDWDLEVLVEVHDEPELDRILAIGFGLVGINNRDLRSFKVDLATTERLCRRIAGLGTGVGPLVVSESGIATPGDVARVAACGCRAVLVGESLLVQENLEGAARSLLGGARGAGEAKEIEP